MGASPLALPCFPACRRWLPAAPNPLPSLDGRTLLGSEQPLLAATTWAELGSAVLLCVDEGSLALRTTAFSVAGVWMQRGCGRRWTRPALGLEPHCPWPPSGPLWVPPRDAERVLLSSVARGPGLSVQVSIWVLSGAAGLLHVRGERSLFSDVWEISPRLCTQLPTPRDARPVRGEASGHSRA